MESLQKEDREFLIRLAELNELSLEESWEHLFNPVADYSGEKHVFSKKWETSTVENGCFTHLYFGTESMSFKNGTIVNNGYIKFLKVPSFGKLQKLKSFYIHSKCELFDTSLDLTNCSSLEELKIHGQQNIQEIKTNSGLRSLSLLGNKAITKVDISASTLLYKFDTFENKVLRGGVVCTDIQLYSVDNLKKRAKTLLTEQNIHSASQGELRLLVNDDAKRMLSDTLLLKNIINHPQFSLYEALTLYWLIAPALYQKYSSLNDCTSTVEKEHYRATVLIEKKIKEGKLMDDGSGFMNTLGANSFDISKLVKPIPDHIFELSKITKEGEQVKKNTVKKSASPKITKNDAWAINEMTEWLSHPLEYGRPPKEISVYYRKKLYWYSGQEEKVFLMHYKMDDGKSFIGITGPITWSFVGIPMEEINKMYKKTHKLDLINLYAGWHLCWILSERDPSSRKPEPELLQLTEEYLKGRDWDKPKYKESIKVDAKEHLVFSGVQNEKEYFIHVVNEGEKTEPVYKGRILKTEPVSGHIPLFFWIGMKYGPIKWKF